MRRAGTGRRLSLARARDLGSRAGAGGHTLARRESRLAGEGGTPPKEGPLHAPRLNSSLAKARPGHAPSRPARKKRAAGDGRARGALPGYGPPGGAGARLAARAVRGRGPRASPPAGSAAAAAAAASGSRPWPPVPGAQPLSSAPRSGPPTAGGGGAAAAPARGQARARSPASPGPALGAPGARSLARSRPAVSSSCLGRRARARARSCGGGGVRGPGARARGEGSGAGCGRELRGAAGVGVGCRGRGLDGSGLRLRVTPPCPVPRRSADLSSARRRGPVWRRRLPDSLERVGASVGGQYFSPVPWSWMHQPERPYSPLFSPY
jgi:hypothetical protein